jgi:two-component system response regulator PilR (NtrC family)
MQVKLLRAIQEKAIRPVGAAQERPIDVRILSATHKDLSLEVQEGRFRQDLYYRLNVIELPMPSLRERPEDIPELTDQILERLAGAYGGEKPEVSTAAMDELAEYPFPGNVRELENVLERAYTLCEGNRIESGDLQLGSAQLTNDRLDSDDDDAQDSAGPARARTVPTDGSASFEGLTLAPGQSLEDLLEQIERQLINDALEANRWNKTAAAKDLGITFRALRYRLKKLDLE